MVAGSSITRVVGKAMLAAALLLSVGCTNISAWKPSKMFSLDSTWPFRDKDKPREGVPVKMVGTWTDTVMTQPGQKAQRGFGGRIMFYEKEEKNPVLVDGQLIVYAFDEADRDPTDNKPTRRYVFPAEQVPLHMSKSELGASYSFWLPWDEAGGPQAKVSLICRFEPKGGAVVTSEQTQHVLPGTIPVAGASGAKKPPKVPEGVASKPRMQSLESLQAQRNEERQTKLANYEVPVDNANVPAAILQDPNAVAARHMTSATIDLPKNYQLPNSDFALNPARAANGSIQPVNSAYPPTTPAPQSMQQFPAVQSVPIGPSYGQPAGTMPAGLQPVPSPPAFGQLTPGFNSIQFPQAASLQQAQPSLLQQQIAQQQLLQQQAIQQRMMANQPVSSLPAAQLPGQTPAQSAAAALSSQATVTYR
jgi:hypothetical protein